jgi:hypothetical protein
VSPRESSGQATVEWIGLLLLAMLVLAAVLVTVGWRTVRVSLRNAVLQNLVCAVRLTEDCRNEPELRGAYGPEVAAALRANAPALLYEDGMSALPVDFRSCREDACAEGPGEGMVARSDDGQPVAAFTHVVDCRAGAAAATEARGATCEGERAGRLYLQYFFYYPGSATGEGSTPLKGAIRKGSGLIGHSTYHPDDWESVQIRVDPDGHRYARASAHHGYGAGWVRDPDSLYVSGGSHAGQVRFDASIARTTKDHRLRLIPMREAEAGGATFAITPPWRKRVHFDPEYEGTD